jgi:uncharacterized cupin superfamily protein
VRLDEKRRRYSQGYLFVVHLHVIGGTFRWTTPACQTTHQVVNCSDTPCTYLVFGSRAEPDVTHYPHRGEILHDFDDPSWRLHRTDGTLINEGNPDRGSALSVGYTNTEADT